jgi:uncharacterized protein with GYD domain
MARYLVQASYTPEAWAAQLRTPDDRSRTVEPLMERLGARIESFYYAIASGGIVLIGECPDDVDAAAIILAVTASGAFTSLTVTPLLTVTEGLEALRRAGAAAAAYRAPGVAASV